MGTGRGQIEGVRGRPGAEIVIMASGIRTVSGVGMGPGCSEEGEPESQLDGVAGRVKDGTDGPAFIILKLLRYGYGIEG